jgi:hypothetical protein
MKLCHSSQCPGLRLETCHPAEKFRQREVQPENGCENLLSRSEYRISGVMCFEYRNYGSRFQQQSIILFVGNVLTFWQELEMEPGGWVIKRGLAQPFLDKSQTSGHNRKANRTNCGDRNNIICKILFVQHRSANLVRLVHSPQVNDYEFF